MKVAAAFAQARSAFASDLEERGVVEEQARVGAPSLFEFAQATVPFKLEPWQRVLCRVLARCRTEKGLRILVHKPPQMGGTILASQRFPAWMIGERPDIKIGLGMCELGRARRNGGIVKGLVNGPEFRRWYPHVKVPLRDPNGSFSTEQRRAVADSQASFEAMSIQAGMVSRGPDLLVVDDPYASKKEAASVVVNKAVWELFWLGTANVRLSQDSNVVVFFHRYFDDDFAGRLMQHGKWELYRFAMEADGGKDDPTRRAVGELLTRRRTRAWVNEQKKSEDDWLGQFQGRPRKAGGNLVKPGLFKWVRPEDVPVSRVHYRGWDFSLEPGKKNDWAATALLGVGRDRDYLKDVQRRKLDITEAVDWVLEVASGDPAGTVHCFQDAVLDLTVMKQLALHREGRRLLTQLVELAGRNKWQMAAGWVWRAHRGELAFVEGPYRPEFVEECERFKNLPTNEDDEIDAVSTAYEAAYTAGDGSVREDVPPAPGTEAFYEAERKSRSRGERSRSRR